MSNEESATRLKWKIALFSIVLLITLLLPNSVSASPIISTIRFDRTNYTLGSNGTIIMYLEAVADLEQVIFLTIDLYFVQVSSWILRTTPVVQNWYPPINVTAHSTVPLAFSFQMPNDSNIVSGRFYCQETVYFYYGTSPHLQIYKPFVSEAYFQYADVLEACTLTNPSQETYLDLTDDNHLLKDLNDYANSRSNSLQDQLYKYQITTLALVVAIVTTVAIFYATRSRRAKTVQTLPSSLSFQ